MISLTMYSTVDGVEKAGPETARLAELFPAAPLSHNPEMRVGPGDFIPPEGRLVMDCNLSFAASVL